MLPTIPSRLTMVLHAIGYRMNVPAPADPGADPTLPFFSRFFRVAAQLAPPNQIIRYVGFVGANGPAERELFLGLETLRPQAPLPEMERWTISEFALERRSSSNLLLAAQPISWTWREDVSMANALWRIGDLTNTTHWQLAASAFAVGGAPYENDDRVELHPYDPKWKVSYQNAVKDLTRLLDRDILLHVEHVGSTAVPGIPAKPVIDILGEIPPQHSARARIITPLLRAGWEFWGFGDHLLFVRRSSIMGVRTHHLHLAPHGHREWQAVTFRDYLRDHHTAAAEYVRVKERLALQYRFERERYSEAKFAFIKNVLRKSRPS